MIYVGGKMEHILTQRYIKSVNGRTYYWISKKESELTLVFLPGLTANHTLFEKQIMYFHDKFSIIVDTPNQRILTFMRNHGHWDNNVAINEVRQTREERNVFKQI